MATSTNVSSAPVGSASQHKDMHLLNDLMEHVRDYAKEKPETVALWCLGIGFVLGWKLKPW
jgi:hypothetical protein